jgi:uroporphyrinogen-III synthase
MITSANALTALEAGGYEVESLLSIPCFCVGPRTAEKAALFGFRKTYNSDNDGTALAHLISQSLHNRKKAILHIAGRDTDNKAQDVLQKLGIPVIRWPIYEAIPALQLTPHTVQLVQQQKLDAVTVFSVRTAETLKALIQKHALEACCKDLIAIGLSEAVTNALAPLSWRKVVTAPTPTEDAILHCLTENLPVS